MKTNLKGIIPALVTPFDGTGEIDEKKCRAQIHFLLKKGVHGVCFGGSTGEGQTLDIDEFKRLAAITVEEVAGKVPVVAGIIAASTREVIKRGKAIRDLKIEALQVTPVFYVFQPDDEANFGHFKTITQEVGTPVLVCNVIPWNLLSTPLVLRILHARGIADGGARSVRAALERRTGRRPQDRARHPSPPGQLLVGARPWHFACMCEVCPGTARSTEWRLPPADDDAGRRTQEGNRAYVDGFARIRCEVMDRLTTDRQP